MRKSFKLTLILVLALVIGFIKEASSTVTSCYVSANNSVGSQTACPSSANSFCKITFDATTRLFASRSCAATCTPGPTEACCSTDNCNDATVSSCYVLASGATAGVATLCNTADNKYCKVTIATSAVSARSCGTSTCIASSTAACCSSNDCNDAATSDLAKTCYHTDGTNSNAPMACATSTPICKISFDSNLAVSTKSCEKVCQADSKTACCTISAAGDYNCNSATSHFSCLQCDDESTCNSTKTGKACSKINVKGCKTVYSGASGIVQSKKCEDTLVASSSNDEYCTSKNCNSMTKTLSCYQCANEATCNTTNTATPCLTSGNSFCKTTFANGKAQVKSCVASGDCLPDGQTTACCNTDNCNSPRVLLSCYVCDNETLCKSANITPQFCPASSSLCKTTFSYGKAVSKSCASNSECSPSSFSPDVVTCCSGDNCNVNNTAKFCYQCNSEATCNATFTGTPCSDSTAKYCQTTFTNKKATSKSCVATCTSGFCCPDDNCNNARVSGANQSFLKTSFLTQILMATLIPIATAFNNKFKF